MYNAHPYFSQFKNVGRNSGIIHGKIYCSVLGSILTRRFHSDEVQAHMFRGPLNSRELTGIEQKFK